VVLSEFQCGMCLAEETLVARSVVQNHFSNMPVCAIRRVTVLANSGLTAWSMIVSFYDRHFATSREQSESLSGHSVLWLSFWCSGSWQSGLALDCSTSRGKPKVMERHLFINIRQTSSVPIEVVEAATRTIDDEFSGRWRVSVLDDASTDWWTVKLAPELGKTRTKNLFPEEQNTDGISDTLRLLKNEVQTVL